jgi:hypothetical protein
MTQPKLERSQKAPAKRKTQRLSTADMAAAERPDAERLGGPGGGDDKPLAAERLRTGPASRSPEEPPVQLMTSEDMERFRGRWSSIQTGFVDEPRRAVEQADTLVAEVMKRLAEVFADERGKLESQWSRGDNVSTEDLRIALRRYRSFFDRLLSM